MLIAGASLLATELPRDGNPYVASMPIEPKCDIDRLVLSKLSPNNPKPTICSDAVFVRRAFLDCIGTLPSAAEAKQFIDDPDREHKRTTLIDELLQRPEYADYWAMKWADALRIKAEFPINLWPNAAQAYHRWVRASLVANKPYDQFARELLTASGSNFRVAPVNFYRAIQNKTPEGIASAVALTFMGTRTNGWSAARLAGTAVFFSQLSYKPTAEWKEEIVFWDSLKVVERADSVAPGSEIVGTVATSNDDLGSLSNSIDANSPLVAIFPDGTTVQLSSDQDPREVFAAWLIQPKNPWFTKAAVNRVWAWLMGRGIIEQADDIRDDNPPSHPELLAYLEQEFVDSGYDLQHLYRLILTSQVYQFSALSHSVSEDHPATFATYPLRRLDAEVLIDAINSITGTHELYTSPIPEPFTYIPRDQPAIALADGSITSPFLALFGRSPRATGMANEKSNRSVSSQWLHLLNSSHIQQKLQLSEPLKQMFSVRRKPELTLEELYLTVLSRRPIEAEIEIAMGYVKSSKFNRNDWLDLTWALINNTEFLYRH